MAKKRWLTKEEKRLLKPHAAHFSAMWNYIKGASILDLERLNNACMPHGPADAERMLWCLRGFCCGNHRGLRGSESRDVQEI
jgi:hypothetical protein